MLTRRLVEGAAYEVERSAGIRVRAIYLGPNTEDSRDNPLVFMEQGVHGGTPIGRFTTTPRYVIRPWSERVAEQHERAEREREAEEREAAMFTALYGDIPERTVASLSLLNVTAEYRGQPDISGMTCVLDIEGSTKVMSALFIGLTAADVGTPRRLRLAEPLAEYHAFLLAGQDVTAIERFRVSAMGRFSPIELATVLHVANGLRSC